MLYSPAELNKKYLEIVSSGDLFKLINLGTLYYDINLLTEAEKC
jgi:hypothetical protein